MSDRGYNPRRTRVEIDYDGLLGEQAVATLLACPIDENIYLGGDDGNDLVFGNTTVQVKLNTHRHGDLYFNTLKDFKADIAILATPIIEEDVYHVAGWISRQEFIEKHHITDYGYGTRYAVNQHELRPIVELILKEG